MNNRQGFSLIELVVAVGLLAMLTYLTTTTIRNSVRGRKQLRANLAMNAELRDALRIIQQDINRAFHFRDIEERLSREAQQEAAQTTKKPANPAQEGAADPAAEVNPVGKVGGEGGTARPQLTQFIGDESSLHFTSLGHVRRYADAAESDQEEVGYELKECLGRVKVQGQRPSFKCLWRRTSPFIDEDVSRGGAEMVLLENVRDFKLQYLGPGAEEWVKKWRTDERGEPEQKDMFPEAVEITLSVQRGDGKNLKALEMSTVAAVHFPNNEPKKVSADQGGVP